MKTTCCCRLVVPLVLTVAALSTSIAFAEQSAVSPGNKVIIHPSANESIAGLQKLGIGHVVDYGSYWLVEASDEQMPLVEARYGQRVMDAKYMNRIDLNVCAIDSTKGEPARSRPTCGPAITREIVCCSSNSRGR